MELVNLDKQIWLEFKAGDRDALLKLYKSHYLGLINYGIKLTGERQRANDFIVEVLLSLWEKKDRLPDVENVRSYLLTCLRTTIFQQIRSEKLREVKETHASSLSQQYEFSYEEYISKSQTDSLIKTRLLKSFAKLTARQKEILELKFFEDLDYDEIAKRCNISKRTAYNIVYDALKILKDDLKNDKNDDFIYALSLISLLGLQLGFIFF